MPIYEYRCEMGHTTESTIRGDSTSCDTCYDAAHRVFGFQYKPPMQDHFNPTTGQYVRNSADFKSQLSQLSDTASERTGMTHNFQPTDPLDMKSNGVTQEGLRESYDAATLDDRKVLGKYID